MSPTPHDRPDVAVFSEIGVIEHHMRLGVSRHLPQGMSYVQFEVLLHLVREGDGQSPAALAEGMLMGKAAMNGVLRKMAAQGLVTVLTDVNDRRRKRVRVARLGRDAYAGILEAMAWKSDALRDGFTEGEFRAALPFLRALRTFLAEVSETMDEPEAATLR